MQRRFIKHVCGTAGLAVALAVSVAVPGTARAAGPSNISVTSMKTDADTNPLGIDDRTPTLTWALESSQRGVMQTGYRILVASSLDQLRAGHADMWDSHVQWSADPSATYAGRPLQARTRYYWSVQVYVNGGSPTDFSAPAWFETAYLDPGQWQGTWISGPPRDSWTLTSAQGSLDDSCCVAGNTTLSAAASPGGTSVTLGSYRGFFPGGKIMIGSGVTQETATITAAGPAAASTALALPAPAGATNVKVNDVTNLTVGAPITIDTGTAQDPAVVTAVGTAAGSTTLFAPANPGDTSLFVASMAPFAKNTPVVIGSGASQETRTIVGTNTAAPAPTALAAPAAVGDEKLYVNSVTGIIPQAPLSIGTGTSQVTVTPSQVGTAAAAPTALSSAAAAGDTTVTVNSTTGVLVGLPIMVDTGSAAEIRTVTANLASAQTTLAAAASAGDTTIKVASVAGLAAGRTILLDTGTAQESRVIASVGTAGATGTGVTLATPLSSAHASGTAVVQPGVISFAPALTSAHASGNSVRALGGGITLTHPLPAAFDTGTAAQGSGQGLMISPPLGAAYAAGATLTGEGQGVGFWPPLSNAHAAGTTLSAGTGVTFTPALTSAHAAGEPVTSVPYDWCRPVGAGRGGAPADNQGTCRETRPAPMLRKAFTIAPASEHGPVVSARLYASGLGYNSMSVNGAQTSSRVFDPAFTDYTKTVYYTTDNVTSLINQNRTTPAENVVGAELGSGQYDDDTDGGNWGWVTAPWRATPKLISNLWITYADGTQQLIKSDNSWQVTLAGPDRYNSYYIGETYDARKAMPGWNKPGFDAAGWSPAATATPPLGTLTAQRQTPTSVIATWPVGTPTTPKTGVEVYNIGTMRTGYATLEVYGAPAGTPIEVMYSDKNNADGTVTTSGCCIGDQPIQTDYYISDGTGTAANPEVFTPQFSFKATRYVQISAPGGAALPDGVHVALRDFTETRAAMPATGTFNSSSALLNQIESVTNTTIPANYVGGIITDTPEYEKNPWQGDTSLSAPAATLLYDTANYYQGEVLDQTECQSPLGELVQLCPNSGTYGYLYHSPDGGFKRSVVTGSTPIWDSAAFTVPWEAYLAYGDKSFLEQSYPVMQAYLGKWMPRFGLLDGDGRPYTVTSDLGDWSPATGAQGSPADGTDFNVPTVNDASSTAYYAYLATIAADTARALGKPDEAAHYERLHDAIAADYNKAWWDPSVGYYRDAPGQPFTQTINTLALAFSIVPPSQRAALEAKLVNDVLVTRTGHEEVGIVGARWLLPVLSQAAADGVTDAAKAAYAVAQQTTYPSYGNWVSNLGWTGLGEIWESTSRTRSHHMFGSIAQWFYQNLAGIQVISPGYQKIAFKPTIADGIGHVSASYDSVRGTVASSWTQSSSGLEFDVTVPPNATGVVYVPARSASAVTESGSGRSLRAASAPGVRLVGQQGGFAVFDVGSGSYKFQVPQGG